MARSRNASRSSCCGDVHPRCDCVATGGQDEGGRFLGPVRIEVADRDTGASVGQSEGGGAADTTASAGEDGNGSLEVERNTHAIATAFVRTNSSRPSRPPSRPKPEMPSPPNGSSQPTTGEAPFT